MPNITASGNIRMRWYQQSWQGVMPITSPMNSAAKVDTSAAAQAADSKTHPVLDLVGNGPVCPPYVLLMGLAVSLDDETCRRWLTRDRQDGRDLGARTNLEAAGSF